MSRIENLKYVEDQLDTIMKMARIIVDDGDMTKEEMEVFLTEKSNESFTNVFDASEEDFAFMLFADICKKLPRVMSMMKGDDTDEV